MTQPLDALLAACERLRGTLAVATALVVAGRDIDLTGLEVEITTLCVVALRLQGSQRLACRGALLDLRARIEHLQSILAMDSRQIRSLSSAQGGAC